MPQARKSARSSSRRSKAFKEPAALKRLNRSLDAAQKALTELRTHASDDAAKNTRTLHTGLGKFVANARRDTGKLTTALNALEPAQLQRSGALAEPRPSAARASRAKASPSTPPSHAELAALPRDRERVLAGA